MVRTVLQCNKFSFALPLPKTNPPPKHSCNQNNGEKITEAKLVQREIIVQFFNFKLEFRRIDQLVIQNSTMLLRQVKSLLNVVHKFVRTA